MDARYRLVARDKVGLLIALMRLLAGDDARIALEGDLSRLDLDSVSGASTEETLSLKRATLAPRLDFIVLPLNNDSVRALISRALPAGGIVKRVIHIQIEKQGTLQFAAYDNFHPECIVVGPAVPKATLDELLSKRILKTLHPVQRTTDGMEHRS
ncbi:MAG: hypothetical protein ACLQNE_06200 [Thermoguttaceae bacterium]